MKKISDLSALDWKKYIQPNDLVVWGQAQAEPLSLTRHLMQHRHQLACFKVFLGISHYATCGVEHTDVINFGSYCGAGSNRALAKANQLDIFPSHYSTLSNLLHPDVVLIQVSKPNALGQYSFGLGQDYIADMLKKARTVIAEVNHSLPWVYGSDYLTEQDFDILVESDCQHHLESSNDRSEVNKTIADKVAALVANGSTLQMGIGTLPEAVLKALASHKNLGVHSGIIGDGIAELMQKGVINNSEKKIDTGYTVTGLINGSVQLHDYVNQNPNIQLRPTSYTHHPDVLGQIDNLVSINSAIEVDLSGQINAEVANGTYVGAVGGAIDFIRAANQSVKGCSIIALPAAGKNFSRIVFSLSGPVSTPRSDAGIFVTEYGVADLRGLSLQQRAQKMITIAHPEYRAQLMSQAQQLSIF
ncbi:acetyl-CoA hydrolase/transferase C-terminal domain-containing protein [Acinetobacter sp.]|uniref:acetyl-CoA hydrolase/transferase family protein n=1 Tax=Acinetobacter sp. TaxID=472 RepID=UPI0028984180|nr:acetyl-CoA hydrolase/transferase C-terminal domain-containing protein [Acinetobacter sp.]